MPGDGGRNLKSTNFLKRLKIIRTLYKTVIPIDQMQITAIFGAIMELSIYLDCGSC